jgi:membrane-associated protease RseP (regulator of RpoE activity)
MTNYPQFPPEVDPKTIASQLRDGGPQRELIIRSYLWSGLQYSGALMGILLFHEFGHYLQARRYHVPAIPPLFIPMPLPPFGTMGAVIVQSPHHADRKAMFDIAISGPLAGLCLALPIAWWGILHSKVVVFDGGAAAMEFGDPLVLRWMIEAVHGRLAPNETVLINPLLMAGWIGVFITALNLAPVGQLDGGHILYCLIGKKAHAVALLFVVLVVAYMAWSQYWLFSVMLVLMVMMGIRHPPTANDNVPLRPARIILGWLTLAFLLIGIHPQPIVEHGPNPAAAVQPAN